MILYNTIFAAIDIFLILPHKPSFFIENKAAVNIAFKEAKEYFKAETILEDD
jgi:hypothetical protein